ncbi:MAG TPA: hypothetical protein VMS01_00905 [Stellaceae bacterium]|nr:hypothetical protein [Stellaceae bacterium]
MPQPNDLSGFVTATLSSTHGEPRLAMRHGPRREFKIALGFALGYGSAKRIYDLEEVVRFRT